MHLQWVEIVSFLKEPITNTFQCLILSFCILLRFIAYLLPSMEAIYVETNLDGLF